jgi:hypothetical protein
MALTQKHGSFIPTLSKISMPSPTPQFTELAKTAILSIDSGEERVETILLLLQTASDEHSHIICIADVRSAHLMVEMRMHLLEGVE